MTAVGDARKRDQVGVCIVCGNATHVPAPAPTGQAGLTDRLAAVLGESLDAHVGWQMHRGQMIDDLTAALAPLVAEEAAAAEVRALREAADAIQVSDHSCFKPWCPDCHERTVSGWHRDNLLARADRIAEGAQSDG